MGNVFICNLAVADIMVACFADIFNVIGKAFLFFILFHFSCLFLCLSVAYSSREKPGTQNFQNIIILAM